MYGEGESAYYDNYEQMSETLFSRTVFNSIFFVSQAEQVREMDSELKYMKEEVLGNKETADRMPTFCPKNNELCLENNC